MPVISIATRETIPIENHRVIAKWFRPDNSGVAIGHTGEAYYSWGFDTKGNPIPGTMQEHGSEKEAILRMCSEAE